MILKMGRPEFFSTWAHGHMETCLDTQGEGRMARRDGCDASIQYLPARYTRARLLLQKKFATTPESLCQRPARRCILQSGFRVTCPSGRTVDTHKERKRKPFCLLSSSLGPHPWIERLGANRQKRAIFWLTNLAQAAENDENCSACGNTGDVVCCDGCPRSFHFECVDMVRSDHLPDEWYCNECLIRRYPSRVPVHRGILGSALNNLEKSIPRAFSLPKSVQNRFEGVKAGADGDYEELVTNKPAKYVFCSPLLFFFFPFPFPFPFPSFSFSFCLIHHPAQ